MRNGWKIADLAGISAPMARVARGLTAFGSLLTARAAACDGRATVDHSQTRDVASTQWLKLQTIKYRDAKGKLRSWDMVTRTTRSASIGSSGVDAVIVLPLLRRKDQAPETLLALQQPMKR